MCDMPKSKRNKVVSLTKVKKKGRLIKDKLVESIRDAGTKYKSVYLFRPENMRNNSLKNVRNEWAGSKMFLGKNKVMQYALGSQVDQQLMEGVYPLAQRIEGNCGLLFTNKTKKFVVNYFNKYEEVCYARSGNVASSDFKIAKGPLALPFSIEPRLRKLGLETKLDEGIVHLLANTHVVSEGDILTPEQCDLLELFEVKQAKFRISLDCACTNGKFEELEGNVAAGEGGGAADDDVNM